MLAIVAAIEKWSAEGLSFEFGPAPANWQVPGEQLSGWGALLRRPSTCQVFFWATEGKLGKCPIRWFRYESANAKPSEILCRITLSYPGSFTAAIYRFETHQCASNSPRSSAQL